MSGEPRSLAAWLRSWSDEALQALVVARPDLVVPVPADLSVLAARANTRSSLGRALDGLDAFTLAVLDAVLLLDPPVPVPDIERLVGADPAAALERLRALALVWESDGLQPAGGLHEAVERPGGLGRPARMLLQRRDRVALAGMLAAQRLPPLADQAEAADVLARGMPAAVDATTDDERAVLVTVDAAGGQGRLRHALTAVDPADASPVRRLVARGLLVPVDVETVELPREAGLAVRGGAWLHPVASTPPPLVAAGPDRRDVDEAGALATSELVRRVETVLDAWSLTPVPELKSGGLGQRDLRATARLIGGDESAATIVVEVAAAAGLLGRTSAPNPAFAPTQRFDAWLSRPVAGRGAEVLIAWLRMTRVCSGAGGRHRDVNALSQEAERPAARAVRREVLAVLAGAPVGFPVTPESLRERLAWTAPRRTGRTREEFIGETLAEAALLGVTVGGALTSAGRALLDDNDPGTALVQALGRSLPATVDHLLLQADLTAVAPGPLHPDLSREVALLADVESPGSATVYRFSEGSLRRAYDAGRTSGDVQAFLAKVGRPEVPQALAYLVEDVARRHGRLRAGPATSYVRCDDEALLAEVMADKRCAPLGLRQIAPTVLVSPLTPARLLAGLRGASYAPVGEGAVGDIVLGREASTRAPATLRFPVPETGVEPAMAARIVAGLRSGERAAAIAGSSRAQPEADRSLATTQALLAQATRERRPVWIGYVDAQGTASTRIVDPETVSGGLLTGFDHRENRSRTFALHRITEARLVADGT